jgi:hypothetical protein
MGDEVNALSLGCVDGGAIYEARRHAWATERVSMIGDEMLDVTGTAGSQDMQLLYTSVWSCRTLHTVSVSVNGC